LADTYTWSGGQEAVLRLGPADAPLVLIAPALFEEANRTRAFIVAIMRGLAARGVASALPDLPGTNDSLVPTYEAQLAHWRTAFAALAGERPAMGFAIRSGALVDCDAPLLARCHFSPVAGAALIRDMIRTRQASARDGGDRFDAAALDQPGPPVELAGNHLSRALIADLQAAEPSRADRVLRLQDDAHPADRRFTGRTLWRASEPSVDAALGDAIADDLAGWVRTCAG
jgi:hypothetical protein